MNDDVKKPVENARLKSLLGEFRVRGKAEQNDLAEEIAEELAMNTHLLALINTNGNDIKQNGEGTAVFNQNAVVSLVMFKDTDGTDYLPVYTGWDELMKNGNCKDVHVRALILSFDDMSELVAENAGIVVNPFSDSFVIAPQNVASMKRHKDFLKKGYAENVLEKGKVVRIGQPADYPEEMAEAIRQYARTDEAIKAIWLKLMDKENEKSYLLVVDFEGDKDRVFSSTAAAVTSHLHNGMPVDMIPFSDKFGQDAAQGEPIYRHRKGPSVSGI